MIWDFNENEWGLKEHDKRWKSKSETENSFKYDSTNLLPNRSQSMQEQRASKAAFCGTDDQYKYF